MKYWADKHRTLYNGNCRSMAELPDNSIQCCVTSPPYWGLRKYKGEQDLIWGGTPECSHEWGDPLNGKSLRGTLTNSANAKEVFYDKDLSDIHLKAGNVCSLCGAWRGAYGLEPSPEMYVQHTIEILREIRRVLRKDGVVFWNIGDSYATSSAHGSGFGETSKSAGVGNSQKGVQARCGCPDNLKPKDLCLIPFRVAIAAQEDGWWIRSVIIWSKPNPMPESVTDRPTESHDYILMLTKSSRYYWDMEAVREPIAFDRWGSHYQYMHNEINHYSLDDGKPNNTGKIHGAINPAGRNLRSVWTFPTQPYRGSHFATFPEKLPELCIKATTPEEGCCSKCGTAWERLVEISGGTIGTSWHDHKNDLTQGMSQAHSIASEGYKRESKGWQPGCKCQDADKIPSTVLDPFCGSGTTLEVAAKLNRHAVGYEISEEYCKLIVERNRQSCLL